MNSPQKQLEDMKRAYENASTERERAKIELRCWDLHGDEARKQKIRCNDFLHEALGVSSKPDSDHRLFLLRLGPLAEPLWPLVDDEMTLHTAASLARHSKRLKGAGEDSDAKAIERVLEEYFQLPVKRSLGGRKIIRLRTQRPRRAKARGASTKETASKNAPLGSFRAKIRAIALESLKERLEGVDEVTIQAELERFETDLKVLFEEFENRVHDSRRKQAKVEQFIERRGLTNACRVLHLDPPKVVDVTFVKLAKRNFKGLARQYHTDVSGTSSTQAAFDAVMKAWRVIQAFAEKKGT